MGLLASAHDLSDGGLAVALAESCLRGGRGCVLDLDSAGLLVSLFSESAARAVVSIRPDGDAIDQFRQLAEERYQTPIAHIGSVLGDSLKLLGEFEIPLAELAQVWRGTLPAIFG
jgi:phosphoribosylformylglycinamidine synthase